MKDWFCLNCRIHVELTKHGRCPHCDGNGVAPPHVKLNEAEAIAQCEIVMLERLRRQ
jgi:hypothetical protein